MGFKMSIRSFVDLMFSMGLFFNAILFVPQALKIFRQKSVQGLSLFTFAGFNIMQLLTAWHGYLTRDYLLMFGFFLSFFTCGMVTAQLVWYKVREKIQNETEICQLGL